MDYYVLLSDITEAASYKDESEKRIAVTKPLKILANVFMSFLSGV